MRTIRICPSLATSFMMFFSAAQKTEFSRRVSTSPPRALLRALIDTKTRREFRTHRYLCRVCAGAERLAVLRCADAKICPVAASISEQNPDRPALDGAKAASRG
ncbi:hypothetical protein [Caballeronia novacaledonica]|uniref:hypothetical protein n=1 Tax=Caballeronia novacaledonica TaxID=1544861 RepID=UPI001EE18A03|nr:hypothetical protein [Caballeronia novacaledonica]